MENNNSDNIKNEITTSEANPKTAENTVTEDTVTVKEVANEEQAITKNEEIETAEKAVTEDASAEEKGKNKKSRKKKKKRKIIFIVAPILTVLAIIVLALLFVPDLYAMHKATSYFKPIEITDEKFAELAPEFTDMSANIEAMPTYNPDDTWAFYVYIVGSNLESCELDNLSDLMTAVGKLEKEKIKEKNKEKQAKNLDNFLNELSDMHTDVPQVLYEPKATEIEEETDFINNEENPMGAASYNIEQMLYADFGDNLQIILETGGAKRWYDSSFNPNRLQRTLIAKDQCFALWDQRTENMADPDTLSDFIKFCRREYPADHEVLILWDHGGAFRGFGDDEIFGDIMSVKELQEALNDALGNPDENNPPLEAIGFDACFMSTVEVANALNGYAKYLYASEESEPGTGWNYYAIINALNENPSMNGAMLGKVIADSFTRMSIEDAAINGVVANTTFSVLDLSKTDEVYDAYSAFCIKALNELAEDPAVMADISRAADASVHYAGNLAEYYNIIDLSLFMKGLPDNFTAEALEVENAVHDCVLYMRNSIYAEGSEGISVYYPNTIGNYKALMVLLEYIYEISDDPYINMLYYYKTTGCLNYDQRELLDESGILQPPSIDYSYMNGAVFWSPLSCDGSGQMTVELDPAYLPLIQNVRLCVSSYNGEGDYISYGQSADVKLSSDGIAVSDFDGRWLCYGGIPLETSIISESENHIRYKSKVQYNFLPGYMIIDYDKQTEEAALLGITHFSDEIVVDKNMLTPKIGDIIGIIKTQYGDSYAEFEIMDTLTVKGSTKLEMKPLANGTYVECFAVTDLRSDAYATNVVSFVMSRGKLKDQQIVYEYDINDYIE